MHNRSVGAAYVLELREMHSFEMLAWVMRAQFFARLPRSADAANAGFLEPEILHVLRLLSVLFGL